MSKTYALLGPTTQDVLSYKGAIILHGDKDEMSFLFPNCRVVEFRAGDNDLVMRLRDHPNMAPVKFPLSKSDFIQTS